MEGWRRSVRHGDDFNWVGGHSENQEALHCDLKVSRSPAKINKNFANYFLKIKANNNCSIVLKCTC